MDVLSPLITIYAVIILINFLLSLALWRSGKDKLHRLSMLVWATTFANFILQGLFQQKDILTALSFGTYYFTSIVLVSYFSKISGQKIRRHQLKRYHLTMAFAVAASIAISFFRKDIFSLSILLAVAVTLPMIESSFKIFKSFRKHDNFVRLFAGLLFLNSLHFLDFPFLRHDDSNAVIGFSVALVLVFCFSILIPSLSIRNILKNYSNRLEKEVEARTLSLKEVNSELKKAGQDTDTLLSIVCHDIAGPLAISQGCLELMENKEAARLFEQRTNKNLLKTIYSSNAAMSEILTQVRKYHAIRLEKIGFDLTEVDLLDCLSQVADLLELNLDEKNIRIRLESPEKPESLKVLADHSLLKHQVLRNLIINSTKFSSPGSQIEIVVKEIDGAVRLSIVDSGIGIPQKMVAEIFNFDSNTHRKGTNGEHGTGLGMPIVKQCLDAFGAKISIESRSKEDFASDMEL